MFAGEGKEEVAGYIEGYLWRAEGGEDEEPESSVKKSTDAEADGEEEEGAFHGVGVRNPPPCGSHPETGGCAATLAGQSLYFPAASPAPYVP